MGVAMVVMATEQADLQIITATVTTDVSMTAAETAATGHVSADTIETDQINMAVDMVEEDGEGAPTILETDEGIDATMIMIDHPMAITVENEGGMNEIMTIVIIIVEGGDHTIIEVEGEEDLVVEVVADGMTIVVTGGIMIGIKITNISRLRCNYQNWWNRLHKSTNQPRRRRVMPLLLQAVEMMMLLQQLRQQRPNGGILL